VIHGTGKTTLAAELAGRVRDQAPGTVLISLAGPLTLEGLFDAVVNGIRPRLLVRDDRDATEAVRALGIVAKADVSWQDRFAVLRQYVLDRVPVLYSRSAITCCRPGTRRMPGRSPNGLSVSWTPGALGTKSPR
jgi:hypothetical protein